MYGYAQCRHCNSRVVLNLDGRNAAWRVQRPSICPYNAERISSTDKILKTPIYFGDSK